MDITVDPFKRDASTIIKGLLALGYWNRENSFVRNACVIVDQKLAIMSETTFPLHIKVFWEKTYYFCGLIFNMQEKRSFGRGALFWETYCCFSSRFDLNREWFRLRSIISLIVCLSFVVA